jgi:hypothetical protein
MFFTVSVDMADGGHFEFSTESILKFLQTVNALGHPNLEAVEDEDFEDDDGDAIPDDLAHYFDDGEEYAYNPDEDCYCWYDEEHDAWYRLDIETGDWLLIENEMN